MDNFMEVSKPLRVGLYFVSLIACIGICLLYCKRCTEGLKRSFQKQAVLLYLPIAAVALFLTWRNILLFVYEDYSRYENAHVWLQKSEFFVKAYYSISDTAVGWWWSSQLLLFTIVFIVFLNVEARRVYIPMWQIGAYVWLGFGGAISVAMALFCCRLHGLKARTDEKGTLFAREVTLETTTKTVAPDHVASSDPDITRRTNGTKTTTTTATTTEVINTKTNITTKKSSSPMRINELRTTGFSPLTLAILAATAATAFVSIILFTHFTGKAYKYNLFFLHFVLAAPALFPSIASPTSPSRAAHSSESAVLRFLYSVLAGGALAHHMWLTQSVVDFGNFANSSAALLDAGFLHYCQAGISWDAFFVSLLSVLYALIDGGLVQSLCVALLIPAFSPAVTFAIYLFWKEMWPTIASAKHAHVAKNK